MNADNIIHAITRCHTDTKVSGRTGNEYTQLVLTFANGYKFAAFLNDEQKKLIEYAVKEAPVHNIFTNESQPPYQAPQTHIQ